MATFLACLPILVILILEEFNLSPEAEHIYVPSW